MTKIGALVTSIKTLRNEILETGLSNNTCAIELKPHKGQNNEKFLDIIIYLTTKVSNSQYIAHVSSTTFLLDNFSFEEIKPDSDRLDFLTDLGQMAISHSRVLYNQLNPTVAQSIILFRQDIKPEIIHQTVSE
jgi:hypothetical protein